mmetsp:Transcript_1998/g.2868  ORF Transcript_1998/g.2868 Transcript_1998/m.2868 type:complete len:221 (+) Transcript_1998:533-1195(+)
MNHGSPIAICMSKMFDPSVLDTAMAPSPFLAAIAVDMQSGILVPRARNTVPSRTGPTPMMQPIEVANLTISHESPAIQRQAHKKLNMYLPVGSSAVPLSGMVHVNTNSRGYERHLMIQPKAVVGASRSPPSSPAGGTFSTLMSIFRSPSPPPSGLCSEGALDCGRSLSKSDFSSSSIAFCSGLCLMSLVLIDFGAFPALPDSMASAASPRGSQHHSSSLC